MMAFGFVEILVLALLAGGMDNNELVAVVQPKDYFESRNVRMSIDSMIDVAIREPKDGKAQIMQLSALRYLMDESDAFKKASNYASNREAIEEIATGKRAQDKAGFSKEYAQRLLNKLDGKKATAPKKQPLRANAFEWFPDDISLAGALDLRGDGNSDSLKAMLKMLPAREKHQLYAAIENIGNLRIDRVAFGYSDGAERGDGRFYLRMTGKGSHDGLMQLLGQVDGRMQPTEIKPADGAKITLLQSPNNRTPSIVLVGDTDFLLVSAERAGPKARQEDLVQAVLDVRAKKKTSAAEGPFKKRLAKLPEKAVGFVVGEFPGPLKGELQNEFGAVPTNGLVHIERGAQALELHAEGSVPNAEAANKLVKKIADLRKQGIGELQKAMQQPLPAGAPPVPFQAMINVLDTIQVQSQQEKVSVRVSAPNTLLQQLPMLFLMGRGAILD